MSTKIADLEARGFDNCHDGDGYTRLGCSKCEALVIQGTPTHETGCPNQMHECAECMALVPQRQRLCESCANPEDEGWQDDDKDLQRSAEEEVEQQKGTLK